MGIAKHWQTSDGSAPIGLGELIGVDFWPPPLTPRVLVAEDDPSAHEIMVELFERRRLEYRTVDCIGSAREMLRDEQFDILVLDSSLTDGDGLELLEQHPALSEDLVVILVSRSIRADDTLRAFRRGAHDLIVKPFTVAAFEERFNVATERWRSRVRADFYQGRLEDLVEAMSQKLIRANQVIESAYDETVHALGAALHLRDSETEEHCHRVSLNCAELARRCGYPTERLRHLTWGAYLHDIGKIGIPEGILTKPGPLDDRETELIQLHPLLGFRMIANIDFLKESTDLILYHHERYDGGGYLHGLRGRQIPLAARVFAVIDAVDAMLYDRPYRAAMGYGAAVEELRRNSGSQFDPEIVEVYLSVPESTWHSDLDGTGS